MNGCKWGCAPVVQAVVTSLVLDQAPLASRRSGATIATLYKTLAQEGTFQGIKVTHVVTSFDVVPLLQQLLALTPRVHTIAYIEGHKTPDVADLRRTCESCP